MKLEDYIINDCFEKEKFICEMKEKYHWDTCRHAPYLDACYKNNVINIYIGHYFENNISTYRLMQFIIKMFGEPDNVVFNGKSDNIVCSGYGVIITLCYNVKSDLCGFEKKLKKLIKDSFNEHDKGSVSAYINGELIKIEV